MVLALSRSARELAAHPPRLLDHRRAPVLEALRRLQQQDIAPFSTPGHKLGAAVEPDLRDLLGERLFTSDVWLHPACFDEVVMHAEALAADAWGADQTFFLGNGSSCGNHAAFLAMVRPGDVVIVARDLHTSLLTALILSGARPVYVTPRLHPELDVGLGIAPADIARALDAHPEATLVAVVSPTYWGVASDVEGIATVAHARGVPLYVDEAWGPHLPFHPDLPRSALASGADAAVTSVHKLLAGLSQASLLNVRAGRADLARMAAAVRMTRSTSPSLPILASIDACRRQMALAGAALLRHTLELAETVRRRLQAIPGLSVLDARRLGLGPDRSDPCRLVIDVHGLGQTGFAVERALRDRFGVVPEMSDQMGVICLITIGDTGASVNRLVAVFAALATEQDVLIRNGRCRPPRSSGMAVAPGIQVLSPREAHFAASRAVPLAEAAGEVAAELVVPYPPGIPVFAPGEVITDDKISYLREGLRQGMHVRGPADPSLAAIRVVRG
ncbi:MAG: aminotransferase class I/II-fold pyridoxal phosphate-dependent enzyme [Thermomicrobiales bacterium]